MPEKSKPFFLINRKGKKLNKKGFFLKKYQVFFAETRKVFRKEKGRR